MAAATVNQNSSQLRLDIRASTQQDRPLGHQVSVKGGFEDELVKVKVRKTPGNTFLSAHAQMQAGFWMEGKRQPEGEFGESGADPSASPS